MQNTKRILGLFALALVAAIAWQILSAEIGKHELHEIMRDVASQQSARIGLTPPRTDQFFRDDVIGEALADGISLKPEQVAIQRSGTPQEPIIFIRAEYDTPVRVLPGISFSLHFRTSSAK